jgi:hypothetical protein
MASYERLAAVLAVVLVVGVAGSGLFSGAASVTSPLDFSIKDVQFPNTLVKNNPFEAKAVVSNSGTISASQVTYDLRVWKDDVSRGRTEVFRSVQANSKVLTLPAGVDTKWTLVPVDLPNGTYTFYLKIDSEGQFDETSETNNVYETTLIIPN